MMEQRQAMNKTRWLIKACFNNEAELSVTVRALKT